MRSHNSQYKTGIIFISFYCICYIHKRHLGIFYQYVLSVCLILKEILLFERIRTVSFMYHRL